MRTERFDHPCSGCVLGGKKTKVRGSLDAPILVVCKAPTKNMAGKGRHLSRDSTKVFQHFMGQAGFSKEDFAFVSAIRCGYDPKEYPAKERHVIERHCREWLLRVIERVKPEIIVPLGADATKAVAGRSVKITKVRGTIQYDRVVESFVLPMLDPYVVYSYPQHESTFGVDCRTLRTFVDSGYDIDAVHAVEHGEYTFVDDLQYLIDDPPKYLSFDLETVGTRWADSSGSICTMQFCTEPGKAQMLVWDHPERPVSRRRKPALVEQLRQVLQNPGTSVFGQNLKFDRLWVQRHLGFSFRIDHDTIMLAAINDENMLTKNQDDLVKLHVPEMAGYADAFNQTYDKSRMDLIPLDKLLQYGCGDVDANFRLLDPLLSPVEADDGLWAHYRYISIPGINAFSNIEQRGMLVDEEALLDLEDQLVRDQEESRKSLLAQVPRSIKRKHAAHDRDLRKSLSFTRQAFLVDVLFDHPDGFCLTPKVWTKGTEKLKDEFKVPSTSTKDHLPYFFDECPFTYELTEYIKANRVLTANVQSFMEKYIMRDDTGSHIYPTYQLWVAVTGRTSCLHGNTPVVTRSGIKKAMDVVVGDELWTHRGRWRSVTALPPKPDAEMLGVRLSNGEVLTCTPDHVVLLDSGEWTTLRIIAERGIEYAQRVKKAHEGRGIGKEGSEQVQDFVTDCFSGSGGVRCQQRDGQSYDPGARLGRRLQEVCSLQVQGEQAGGEESSIWKQLGIRLRGWEGLPDPSYRGQEALCSSDCDGGGFRVTDSGITGIVCGPPYRRGLEEQQSGQLGVDDQARACADSRTLLDSFRGHDIEEIQPAGSSRVYDFSVAEDESYLACGVFSHNSRDPNGQNIPKRGEVAKAYRKIFIAPPGFAILGADLSQAELRISADMANDRTMLGIYNSGGDIHRSTALIVMGVTDQKFSRLSRDEQGLARFKAKAVNFGFIYGMGWRKFIGYAKTQYGVEFTEDEAQRIRERFFSKYSALQGWHKRMRELAHRDKQVRSYSGRIRHLPMVDSEEDGIVSEAERQAINSPVQEFASSLGVMSMGRLDREIDPEYLQIIGFVHDAIYTLVPLEYVEWGAKTLKYYMESNNIQEAFGVSLKCPIVADVEFGLNGADMYEMSGLSLDDSFGFSTIEGLAIDLPEQQVPTNNGRVGTPEYMEIYV